MLGRLIKRLMSSCYSSNKWFLLRQFIREKYWEYEYEEVVTPNMYNLDLWKTSGHADHYKVRCCSFISMGACFHCRPCLCRRVYMSLLFMLTFCSSTGHESPDTKGACHACRTICSC